MQTSDATTPPQSGPADVALTTLALRVHDMKAMVGFYSEAFGVRFEAVNVQGLRSQFGRLGDVMLKFVSIREAADFDGFPLHQPGFVVPDVRRVLAIAVRHGGRQEGSLREESDQVQVAIRDPDGNTIELYGPG